jgi:Iron-sulfur cluster binding domain of dihydroorotate dehydrogenase B
MRRTRASVVSLLLSPSGKAALRLALPASALPVPGQVMLACRAGGDEPLRQTLLPIHIDTQGLTALQPEATSWQPGEVLDLLGPVGRGFRPSPTRRRWLLAALGIHPDVLLPLMESGVERGASVAVWADAPLPVLPPQVEVPSDLEAALDWADYAGFALTPERLEADDPRAALLPTASRSQQTEALVILPMPCGTGICGACAMGARGLLRACVDGPVIALEAWAQ